MEINATPNLIFPAIGKRGKKKNFMSMAVQESDSGEIMKQALKSGHFIYDTLNAKPRTLFYLNLSKTGRGCHDG